MNTDRFSIRVWNEEHKEMYYQGQKTRYGEFLGVNKDGVIFDNGKTHFAVITIIFGDRFIPMQCYGQRDKNKKLIYADDMITGLYDDYELAEAMGFEEGGNFKITNGLVKFEHGCFSLYEIDCSHINDHEDFSCYMNMTKDLEIIGNKWEQPELWELKE